MSSILGVSAPNQWGSTRLKYLAPLITRGSAPEYADSGTVRAISQAANQPDGLDWERTRFHAFDGDVTLLKGHLQAEDIIVNSTGTGTIGRVGYFTGPPDNIPCMTDGHVTLVRSDRAKIWPRFAYYWLGSQVFQEYLLSSLTIGSTNQIELDREGLANAPVPVPEIRQQRVIADFLDREIARIDRLKAIENRALRTLDERRSAGIHAEVSGAFPGRRRESRLAWVDTLPHDWIEVRLGLVARMGSGHTPSRSRPEWWIDCTIPWITTGEVRQVRDDRLEVLTETREMISELGMENSSAELCSPGTVVLCRTASAGYSAVMGRAMATSQDFVTWSCSRRLSPYYLLWCLRAMRPDLLGRLAMGSTHKTIYVPDLQMLRIPLPELSEQESIVDRIRSRNCRIDKLIDRVRTQLDLLSERRQALITAAVTGQFDVSAASGRGVTE